MSTKYVSYKVPIPCYYMDWDQDYIVPYRTLVIDGIVYSEGRNLSFGNIHCRNLSLKNLMCLRSISFKSLKVRYVYIFSCAVNDEIIKDIFSKWTCKKIYLVPFLKEEFIPYRISKLVQDIGIPWEVITNAPYIL